jgi:NADH-quinone oxidoreductase subunit M
MPIGLLSLLIFCPVLGAVFIGLWPRLKANGVRIVAAISTLLPLAISLYLFAGFDRAAGGTMQFEEKLSWIPAISANYHLGVDGLSLPLVVLTSLLGFFAVLISWRHIEHRVKEFFIWLLILETSILGVFCALDLLLFFIFWEIEVIPMYFLISTWGSGRKEYSAMKYVLFTLAGSAFMLAGILSVYFATHSLDIVALAGTGQLMIQSILPAAPIFFLLFAGFAIKLPVFPLHTWLPDAHTDAPTAASVMLAGSLIKMGGYGMIRLCLGFFPQVARDWAPLLLALAVVNIVYGGAITLRQTDLKRLIAYSSISHMGFVLLGIFALSQISLTGAALQMVSHGLITGLLFAVAGIIMHNTGQRNIGNLGGLARQMPVTAAFFIVGGLGALALPSTSGFVAEFTVLLGAFTSSAVSGQVFVYISLAGVLLAAAYILWLVERVFFGPVRLEFDQVKDATSLERLYATVLIGIIFLIGIVPGVLTGIIPGAFAGILKFING